jgi:hypothetical protein
MISQGMNVFWYEAFEDGYMLFYLNDCCTPEQLNVLDEATLIGVTSALHVQKPVIKYDNEDGKSYAVSKSTSNSPTIIKGSMDFAPKAKLNKRKK